VSLRERARTGLCGDRLCGDGLCVGRDSADAVSREYTAPARLKGGTIAKVVDDLAFLMAMTSKSNVHGPAAYLQNTGFLLPGFPCMGAWMSYGLGSFADNVPAFIALAEPISREE
jgi:hypothetical protein